MLETKISDLTKAIDALTAALDAQSLSAPVDVVEAQVDAVLGVVSAPEPEATPDGADIDTVTALALKASRNGHGDAIKAKLAEIGAPRISRLDAAGLATFAAWVEGLDQ